ncbi:hypothetical protein [Mariniblastus fucicola]|uniref:Cytochrome C n=1 Tax=Mariniblastus fucicola TaxID=980251 RepID=A0A5B9PBS3_9BACT|nr:hypothetical protein [Mariniblastus fucicola]QEG20561.1 hypothetical protein MFFC18_04100 [Mariniblastus fucicola]
MQLRTESLAAIFTSAIMVIGGAWVCAKPPLQTPALTNQANANQQEQVQSEPERVDDTQLYMDAKLANSQKVLAGLVTEDFVKIRDSARQLKKIAEAAHWPRSVDEVYQHYSVSFRRQCDKLAEHAEREDLQAAHYTYLHMSTTCIDCHGYVRSRFRIEKPAKGGPVKLIPTQWDGPTRRKHGPQPDDDDLDG